MSWGAFLAAAAGPIAKKVLAALGVGVISYVGFGALEGQISSAVAANIGSLPASVYQIVAKAGMVDAVRIWLAAISVAVTLMTIKRLGVLA